MKITRFVIAIIIGFSLFLSVGLFLKKVFRDQYNYGLQVGKTMGQCEMLEKIQKEFDTEYRSEDGYHPLLEVKTDAVVIVKRNGIKTICLTPRQ